MRNTKVDTAVAGFRRMHKRLVRALLNRVLHANVIAVCSTEPSDLSWARDEYKDEGIVVYEDYGAMVNHPGLQAVWVSASADADASQTLAAIGKNLHVLCEKPLSTDLEQVRRHSCSPRYPSATSWD